MYMAPEVSIKKFRLKSAFFTDLTKIDMWAIGMFLLALLYKVQCFIRI